MSALERSPAEPEAEHLILRILDATTAALIREALQLEKADLDVRLNIGSAAG